MLDSGQDWGDSVVVSTAGNGERFGEAPLPFDQCTSRLYILHADPLERGDPERVPAEDVSRIIGYIERSWGHDRLPARTLLAPEGPTDQHKRRSRSPGPGVDGSKLTATRALDSNRRPPSPQLSLSESAAASEDDVAQSACDYHLGYYRFGKRVRITKPKGAPCWRRSRRVC